MDTYFTVGDERVTRFASMIIGIAISGAVSGPGGRRFNPSAAAQDEPANAPMTNASTRAFHPLNPATILMRIPPIPKQCDDKLLHIAQDVVVKKLLIHISS